MIEFQMNPVKRLKLLRDYLDDLNPHVEVHHRMLEELLGVLIVLMTPEVITPDQARERMPNPRAVAAKILADGIESLIATGNQNAALAISYADVEAETNAVIARLLEYERAGWTVAFFPGYALVSFPELPEVVS
jgi:2-phospho-L-lactate guanylyltransferase (CobY/MobA/RfbA family)